MQRALGAIVLLCLCAAAARAEVVEATAACTESDYTAAYSNCDSGTRLVAYHWIEPKTCSGGVGLPESFVSVSCDCTLFDYAATYSDCVDASRTLTYVKQTDCSGGVEAPLPTTVPCQCTASDAEADYTDCDLSTQTRQVVYYWDAGLTCDLKGAVLPPAITGLPCSVNCGPGEYLPMGARECRNCSAGSYSLGGGAIFNSWDYWALEFTSACVRKPAGTCLPWSLQGTQVVSGDNPDGAETASTLYMNLKLVKDGFVEFTYKVDGESKFDGMTFSVDGVQVLPADPSLMLHTVMQWTLFKYDLTAGYHTLAWTYRKDASVSRGADSAMIQSIEVIGIETAIDRCARCTPGTYAPADGAFDCPLCPANSVSALWGASTCDACPTNQYSFPGDTTCRTRTACSTNDYIGLYGPCQSNGQSDVTYEYLSPVICNTAAYNLPADILVDCPACNPGSYRINNVCTQCTAGMQSDGTVPCSSCPYGSAALPNQYYTTWDSFYPGMTTSCVGACASDGWRLRHNQIDSGLGRAGDMDSVLALTVDLAGPGTVTATIAVKCSTGITCSVELVIDDESKYKATVTTETQYTQNVDAGTHLLEWIFHKSDRAGTNLYGRGYITSIVITNTTTGGAGACTKCPPGFAAEAGAASCTLCGPGTQSSSDGSWCEPCPANSFSDGYGQMCFPCGYGTTSPAGATECSETCQFSPDGVVQYDLSALASTGNMYGPVGQTPTSNHQYFVNVCSKQHSNVSCYDSKGNPIVAYACQGTAINTDFSLGDVIGFQAHPNGSKAGVILEYTRGTPGCNTNRALNITMNCNAKAGVGYPAVPISGLIESPARSCRYNLVWDSLYACPLCSADFYASYVSDCHGATRTRRFFWLTVPPACHDGVQLPPDEEIPCAGDVICPSGQYEGTNSTCIACSPGSYSLGGGVKYSSWDVDFASYGTVCTPAGSCTDWAVDAFNSTVLSGTSGESRLEQIVNVAKGGVVTFVYQWAPMHPGSMFEFTIDEMPKMEILTLTNGAASFSYPLSVGSHTLDWIMTAAAPGEHPVILHSVTVEGVTNAAFVCSLCGVRNQGEISPHPGAHSCTDCPADSVRTNLPATTCGPCPEGTFRLAGQLACLPRPTCAAEDSTTVLSSCANNQQTSMTIALAPYVCSNPPVGNPTTVACYPCPAGTSRQSTGAACVPCPVGSYVTADGTCAACNAGSAAVRTVAFNRFDDPNNTGVWPSGWTTSCAGSCGTSGWRMAGETADSGAHHFGTVDVRLQLHMPMAIAGTVTFEYSVSGGAFMFYVDGVATAHLTMDGAQHEKATTGTRALQFESYLMNLPAGAHNLVWVYSITSPADINGQASLRNVAVTGTSNGGAASCTPCPAGTYTSAAAMDHCIVVPAGYFAPPSATAPRPCPNGTFSEVSGSATCTACGAGTYSNTPTAATDCTNPCSYSPADGITYDLSKLVVPAVKSVDMFDVLTSATESVYFKLCSKVHGAGACAVNNVPLKVYACAEEYDTGSNPIRTINLGTLATYSPSRSSPDNGLRVTFTGGDVCETLGANYHTVIDLVCDVNAGIGVPTYVPSLNSCERDFSWRTVYACPVCTTADWTATRPPCNNGQRTVTWVRSRPCNGAAPPNQSESCSANAVELPWTIIGVVAGAFIVMTIIAVVVCVRHRTLTYRYSALLGDGQSMPMGMYDDAQGYADQGVGNINGDGFNDNEFAVEHTLESAGDSAELSGDGNKAGAGIAPAVASTSASEPAPAPQARRTAPKLEKPPSASTSHATPPVEPADASLEKAEAAPEKTDSAAEKEADDTNVVPVL